ncbi:MAG: DoxX family membrane protein [Patescibacteria group bacterium]
MVTLRKFSMWSIAAALFMPLFASAHVKWFVDVAHTAPIRSYSITDGPVLAWIAIAVVIVGIAILLEKKLPSLRSFSHPFFDYIDPAVISLFSIIIGFGLVVFSWEGYGFAPNLISTTILGELMLAFQATIGFALVLGVFVKLASVGLLALFFTAMLHFGFGELSDAFEVVGIALILLLFGRPHWTLFDAARLHALAERYRDYAVPLLRVFTGVNLVILGFSEKILHPELGMAFLAEYHWNFMQMLGFENFTDYWFVLSAGTVEALFGVMFILGLVTRLTAVFLLPFFFATLILMGPVELFAHILHFAILLTLLVFGSGRRLKFIRTRLDNTSIV